MILGIMGILLIVATIFIQYYDSQIQDVNRKVFLKQGRVNNDALLLVNYYQIYFQYSLYDVMEANLTFFNDSDVNQYMSEDMSEVYEEYFNSNISDKELYLKVKEVIWEEIENKHKEYNTHHFELENITYGDLFFWKNLFTYYFQIPIIVINVLGYTYIMR